MRQYQESKLDSLPDDPLFSDKFGTILRRAYLNGTLRLMLSLCGVNPSLFTAHSLRAGSATTAADVGMTKWEIQMLGRLRSEAYQVYLHNPKIVASFVAKLVN